MFSIKKLRFILIARVVISLPTLGKFSTDPPEPRYFMSPIRIFEEGPKL